MVIGLHAELDGDIAMNSKREILAELAHAQWSGWMEYLFSKGVLNEDGTWTMPAWAVERWRRQMKTSYNELSFDEKESDRKEADKFLLALSVENKKDGFRTTTRVRLPTLTNGINFTGGDSNMSNNENAIEQEIQDKGLTAPRLTPALIDATIDCETYTVLPSGRVTICEMTLKNGFVVLGESSCVSKENFNAELGQKIARENARNKIWELEGYLLKQRLFETQNCTPIANFG